MDHPIIRETVSGIGDTVLVVSEKVSLKFCHEFAEIRSLKPHV